MFGRGPEVVVEGVGVAWWFEMPRLVEVGYMAILYASISFVLNRFPSTHIFIMLLMSCVGKTILPQCGRAKRRTVRLWSDRAHSSLCI